MTATKICVGFAAIALAASAHAASFSEGFDDVAALASAGWLQSNTGTAPTTPWFQGNDGVFPSQSGAPASYIAANYLSSFGGPINNWLISPVLTLQPGAVLSFYTESAATIGFGDVLEVLFSTGSGSAPSGFVSLGTIGSPGVSGTYPGSWTFFSYALPTASTGRFAFRLGGTVDTADYVGIDSVNVKNAVAAVPEPSTYALMALGLAGLALARRRAC